MDRKKLRVQMIVAGVLALVALAVAIFMMLPSFISSFTQLPTQIRTTLENGGLVEVAESRTFEIFFEESAPLTLSSYELTFINTIDQSRITSYAPDRTARYSVGLVGIVNGVPVSGTFGTLVALVDLEAGIYIVEYQPLESIGTFVFRTIEGGMDYADFPDIPRLMLRLLPVTIVFWASLIIFIVLHGKLEKAERTHK